MIKPRAAPSRPSSHGSPEQRNTVEHDTGVHGRVAEVCRPAGGEHHRVRGDRFIPPDFLSERGSVAVVLRRLMPDNTTTVIVGEPLELFKQQNVLPVRESCMGAFTGVITQNY